LLVLDHFTDGRQQKPLSQSNHLKNLLSQSNRLKNIIFFHKILRRSHPLYLEQQQQQAYVAHKSRIALMK